MEMWGDGFNGVFSVEVFGGSDKNWLECDDGLLVVCDYICVIDRGEMKSVLI